METKTKRTKLDMLSQFRARLQKKVEDKQTIQEEEEEEEDEPYEPDVGEEEDEKQQEAEDEDEAMDEEVKENGDDGSDSDSSVEPTKPKVSSKTHGRRSVAGKAPRKRPAVKTSLTTKAKSITTKTSRKRRRTSADTAFRREFSKLLCTRKLPSAFTGCKKYFRGIVRDIVDEINDGKPSSEAVTRISKDAFPVLLEAAESEIVRIFSNTLDVVSYAKRETVTPESLRTTQRIMSGDQHSAKHISTGSQRRNLNLQFRIGMTSNSRTK